MVAVAAASAFFGPFRGLRRACRGSERRASRRMNQPITKITTTPSTNSPAMPSRLGPELLPVSFVCVGAGAGAVCVGAGCCAGGIGEKGLLPGAGVWANAGAAIASAAEITARRRARRATYLGGVAPPLPPLPDDGGLTPPVPGSTPPPLLPWPLVPPPVPDEPPPVPLGACGVADDVPDDGDGAAVPPLEPALGAAELPPSVDVVSVFVVDDGCGVVTPPLSGVVDGWKVWVEFEDEPPPLDAITIITIRNRTTPPKATSRRRR